MQTLASIGVDWGTHSSKWTWSLMELDSSKIIRGPFKILHSDVRLEGASNKIFLSDETPPTGSICASRVKRKLITDTDGSFWVGPQRGIKLTRGELVSFSIWFLLGEAYQNLCDATGKESGEIDVRFSIPNWVDSDASAVGRALYEQAARVACHIFAGDRQAWSQVPNPLREEWQESVRAALEILNISDESEIDTDRQGYQSLLKRSFNVAEDVKFRFVAESSAAGLAGLRNAEVETEEKKYLRKILVVDVGAGSTDIGYVIRAIPPKGSDAKEFLCQLPPANTCESAGDDLSRRILEICRSRGEDIGFSEAERRKTVGEDKGWLTHPAVVEWRRTIADHVRRYVTDIPDMHRLYSLPGLQVLLTGGSGVVGGLQDAVLDAAREGLHERKVHFNVVEATNLMELNLEGPDAKDANRLAVAIGAASEDLPGLSYHPKLERPPRVPTVRIKPSWT